MAHAQALGGLMWAEKSGADLTGKVDCFAKIDTDGDVNYCGSGGIAIGTITEGNIENKPSTIQIGGVVKVIAGAAVNPGVEVQSDVDGKAITYSSGYHAGIALTGATEAGHYISVKMA